MRITPAIATVSSYTTCSVLSILSAVAITSFASFHPQEQSPHITLHSTPTTQNILHVCCILCNLIFSIPPTKVLHFSDMCKQIYHNSIHCIRKRSNYVFVLRLIFRQRRSTCSLSKVFKLFTSVRLKSVKNSPSPKPTTSFITFCEIRVTLNLFLP